MATNIEVFLFTCVCVRTNRRLTLSTASGCYCHREKSGQMTMGSSFMIFPQCTGSMPVRFQGTRRPGRSTGSFLLSYCKDGRKKSSIGGDGKRSASLVSGQVQCLAPDHHEGGSHGDYATRRNRPSRRRCPQPGSDRTYSRRPDPESLSFAPQHRSPWAHPGLEAAP